MTKRKMKIVKTTQENSFEHVLGVEPGSTEVMKTEIVSELIKHVDYDDKDAEIEEDFAEVQDKALELYEYLFDELEDADPSKKARIAEVAGQLLNTALSAGERRRMMKKHIDELKVKKTTNKGGGGNTLNQVFIGSQQDALDFLESQQSRPAIDVTDADDINSED